MACALSAFMALWIMAFAVRTCIRIRDFDRVVAEVWIRAEAAAAAEGSVFLKSSSASSLFIILMVSLMASISWAAI